MASLAKKIVILALIVTGIYCLLKYSGITYYLSLHNFLENKLWLEDFVARHYATSVLLYILSFSLIIILVFPGFPPLTIIGGYLFGVFYGSLYALIGSFIGSFISFFVIKSFFYEKLRVKYEHRLASFKKNIASSGEANTLLFLHFLTIVPFFVINTLAALADVSLFTFTWTTIVGSLPLLLAYSFAGQKLRSVGAVRDIFSLPVIALFGMLILLSVVPMIVKRYKRFSVVVEE